jgi:2-methylisocitrate lyase-like PEP mutase family enzyme
MAAIQAAVPAVAPRPANVLIGPRVQYAELAAAGVRCVSLGGGLDRPAI